MELTELDNVGDGYYAEYPSRQRGKRKSLRPLEEVAPIAASFVRSENAFKIPRTMEEQPALFEQNNMISKDIKDPFRVRMPLTRLSLKPMESFTMP